LYYEYYNSNTAITTGPVSAYLDNFAGLPQNIPWYFIGFDTKITQYAAFGEASYKLSDFKLTAGLRYFDYSEPAQRNLDYGAIFSGTTASSAGITSYTNRASASGINPRVNLSYTPDPDLTLYVQAAKGFRPGVGVPPAPTGCTQDYGALPTSSQPDSVWSYELGEKAQLMNGRFTLNGDVYYEDWQGIQTTISLNSLGCSYNYTGNAGNAAIYGSDLEATLHITPEIAFSTSLGFADATYTYVDPSAESAFYLIEKGDELQLVSKWTDTTSLVYTHNLNNDYNLVLRATDIYKSEQHFQGFPVPETNFINLRFGLSSKQRVSTWLFVNNVTNSSTFTGILDNQFGIDAPYLQRGISPQPRTIGLQLDYAFGAR
jgi:outer membrane receptor protein involved in Fe transport